MLTDFEPCLASVPSYASFYIKREGPEDRWMSTLVSIQLHTHTHTHSTAQHTHIMMLWKFIYPTVVLLPFENSWVIFLSSNHSVILLYRKDSVWQEQRKRFHKEQSNLSLAGGGSGTGSALCESLFLHPQHH